MQNHLCSIAASAKVPDFRSGWLYVWYGNQNELHTHGGVAGGPIALTTTIAAPSNNQETDSDHEHNSPEKQTRVSNDSSLWRNMWCRLKGNILFFYNSEGSSDTPLSCAVTEGLSVTMLEADTARSVWGDHMPKYPISLPSHDLGSDSSSEGQSRRRGEGERQSDAKYVLRVYLAGQHASDHYSALYLRCSSKASATQWRMALRQCTVCEMQDRLLQAEKDTVCESKTALSDKLLKLERDRHENTILSLRHQVESLTESNMRLQSAAEVTEKAASEATEQQVFRVKSAKIQITKLKTELSDTSKRLEASLDRFDLLSRDYRRQQFRCAEVEDTLRRIREDWESTQDKPARIVQSMQRHRDENQELILENKRIKREVEGSAERFHELESVYGNKLKRLKEIMEASEIFKFLQIRLLLALNRIKYVENAFHLPDDESTTLRDRVVFLQKAVKMAETSARSEYVKHRSLILAEQMQLLSSSKSIDYEHGESELKASRLLRNTPAQSEYFALAKTTLDRLGWLLNETRNAEFLDGTEESNLMAPTGNEWLRGYGSTVYAPSDVIGMELMDLPEPHVPLGVHTEAKLKVHQLQAHLRSQERLLRQQEDRT